MKILKNNGVLDSTPDLTPINLATPSDKKKLLPCPYHLMKSAFNSYAVVGIGAMALGAVICKKR